MKFNASLVSFSGKTVVLLMDGNDHIPFLTHKEDKKFSVSFDDVAPVVPPAPKPVVPPPPVPPAHKA